METNNRVSLENPNSELSNEDVINKMFALFRNRTDIFKADFEKFKNLSEAYDNKKALFLLVESYKLPLIVNITNNH